MITAIVPGPGSSDGGVDGDDGATVSTYTSWVADLEALMVLLAHDPEVSIITDVAKEFRGVLALPPPSTPAHELAYFVQIVGVCYVNFGALMAEHAARGLLVEIEMAAPPGARGPGAGVVVSARLQDPARRLTDDDGWILYGPDRALQNWLLPRDPRYFLGDAVWAHLQTRVRRVPSTIAYRGGGRKQPGGGGGGGGTPADAADAAVVWAQRCRACADACAFAGPPVCAGCLADEMAAELIREERLVKERAMLKLLKIQKKKKTPKTPKTPQPQPQPPPVVVALPPQPQPLPPMPVVSPTASSASSASDFEIACDAHELRALGFVC